MLQIVLGIGITMAKRARDYVSWFQFIIIMLLYFRESAWSNWYLLSIPIGILWMIFDYFIILPAERNFLDSNSKRLNQIVNWIEDQERFN